MRIIVLKLLYFKGQTIYTVNLNRSVGNLPKTIYTLNFIFSNVEDGLFEWIHFDAS